ncbi:unnamed protein product [Closterium sp. NIES-65]|nr:unnamed protein product [Closterium sp. NIES-65]
MLGKRGLCRHDPHAAFAHRGKEKVTRLDEVAIWARTLQRLKDGARAVFTSSASPPSAHALPATAPIYPPAEHPARPAPVEEFAPQYFPPAVAPAASPSMLRQWWQPAAVGQQRRAQGQAERAGAGGGLGSVASSGVRACCCGDGGSSAAHSGGACMRCRSRVHLHPTLSFASLHLHFSPDCLPPFPSHLLTICSYDQRMDRFFCIDCSHHHC